MYPILVDATTNSAGGDGLLLLIFAALYFMPSIIAITRKVYVVGQVIVIIAFLGWTLIGWVVALAMAFRRVEERRDLVEDRRRGPRGAGDHGASSRWSSALSHRCQSLARRGLSEAM